MKHINKFINIFFTLILFSSSVFAEEWIIIQSWNDQEDKVIAHKYQWNFDEYEWNFNTLNSYEECEDYLLKQWKKDLNDTFSILTTHNGVFEQIVIVINNSDVLVQSQFSCIRIK